LLLLLLPQPHQRLRLQQRLQPKLPQLLLLLLQTSLHEKTRLWPPPLLLLLQSSVRLTQLQLQLLLQQHLPRMNHWQKLLQPLPLPQILLLLLQSMKLRQWQPQMLMLLLRLPLTNLLKRLQQQLRLKQPLLSKLRQQQLLPLRLLQPQPR
jgi:hypothetical protein